MHPCMYGCMLTIHPTVGGAQQQCQEGADREAAERATAVPVLDAMGGSPSSTVVDG